MLRSKETRDQKLLSGLKDKNESCNGPCNSSMKLSMWEGTGQSAVNGGTREGERAKPKKERERDSLVFFI